MPSALTLIRCSLVLLVIAQFLPFGDGAKLGNQEPTPGHSSYTTHTGHRINTYGGGPPLANFQGTGWEWHGVGLSLTTMLILAIIYLGEARPWWAYLLALPAVVILGLGNFDHAGGFIGRISIILAMLAVGRALFARKPKVVPPPIPEG